MNDPSVSSPPGDNFDTTDSEAATQPGSPADVIDLDAIERDLTDVQTALERLNEGSYWTDEITGGAIPDEVLATFPLTRTVAGNTTT